MKVILQPAHMSSIMPASLDDLATNILTIADDLLTN